MAGRERYVVIICDVCAFLEQESEFTVELDEDEWQPDRCEDHLDWEWSDEKNAYIDPNADEEDQEEEEGDEESAPEGDHDEN